MIFPVNAIQWNMSYFLHLAVNFPICAQNRSHLRNWQQTIHIMFYDMFHTFLAEFLCCDWALFFMEHNVYCCQHASQERQALSSIPIICFSVRSTFPEQYTCQWHIFCSIVPLCHVCFVKLPFHKILFFQKNFREPLTLSAICSFFVKYLSI